MDSNLKTILKVKDFNFKYPNNDEYTIKNINMDIYKNKVTALIGPSGCGKTTLLRCFNRIHDIYANCKYEGEIMYNGKNIVDDKKIDLIKLRMNIGMIFQKPTPFPMSIYDNIAYGMRLKGIKKKSILDEKIEIALKDSALFDEVKDKLKVSASALSGGQQQRLCIARAIAINSKVLLFDEPTSALDPLSTAIIEQLVVKLKKEVTIIIVTHNMQQASRVSDYTAFMYMGKMVEINKTEKIFVNPQEELTEQYISGNFG